MKYTQDEITKAHGPYHAPSMLNKEFISNSIKEIETFPDELLGFFVKLKPEHQEARYREGGWSFRQVIHHLADSHMQAYTRFKLALTEDKPIIKPYSQNAWSETPDSLEADASISINLLIALHQRWTLLMKSMSEDDFQKTFIHPELQREFTLGHIAGLYAWHGKHHFTQIYRCASNNGWI